MNKIAKHYSVSDIESKILAAIRAVGLNPEKRLTPEELGALDHFHTGGFRSSLALQAMAKIRAEDCVLDVGAGLAGAARMLAASPGCHVDCIELSEDYCVGAKLLNRITGLESKVKIFTGSAPNLPFPDKSFDVVWMQNVGMNIENKQSLYKEFHRVLKLGGRLAFQELIAGKEATSYYPLPWATTAEENFLVTAEELHSLLSKIGFEVVEFEDASEGQLSGAPTISNVPAAAPTPQLSLSTYVDNLAQKGENAQRALREGQIRFVRAIFRV